MYNDGVQSALDMSPYECLFGIKSNLKPFFFFYKGVLLRERDDDERSNLCDIENDDSPEIFESHPTSDLSLPTGRQKRKLMKDGEDTGLSASDISAKKATDMVHQNPAKYPPNVYNVGELVLVKSQAKDKGIRRGGLSLSKPKVYKGLVCGEKKSLITSTKLF